MKITKCLASFKFSHNITNMNFCSDVRQPNFLNSTLSHRGSYWLYLAHNLTESEAPIICTCLDKELEFSIDSWIFMNSP